MNHKMESIQGNYRVYVGIIMGDSLISVEIFDLCATVEFINDC